MNRISPEAKARIRRIDLMLLGAVLALTVAYKFSHALSWSTATPFNFPLKTVPVAVAPVDTVPPPSLAAIAAAPGAGTAAQAWDKMTHDLTQLAARYPGRVAIYLKDLRSGQTWMYHPDDLFPAASLIKVPVLAATFFKIHDGELSLSEKLMLTPHTRTGGSGSLKWRPNGTQLSVYELLVHMISESDNTATAMLLNRVGLSYVQEQLQKMGLVYTGIYDEGMSLKGGRVARENYTTAREMTMLLEKIYRGELVDKIDSAMMLGILKHKKPTASRLAKGLPSGWEIAHKTGLLRMACHDSAIFLTPHGDYAMTVLTGDNHNYHMAKNFITRLGRITFRAYAGVQSAAHRRRHRTGHATVAAERRS